MNKMFHLTKTTIHSLYSSERVSTRIYATDIFEKRTPITATTIQSKYESRDFMKTTAKSPHLVGVEFGQTLFLLLFYFQNKLLCATAIVASCCSSIWSTHRMMMMNTSNQFITKTKSSTSYS